jgi:hypothetical protein
MKNPIPKEWLSTPRQKRIICHWTVGPYLASEDCLSSYHILVESKDGVARLARGDDDLDTPTPHTYMFNSAIGLSICALGGYQSQSNPGPYPITEGQWDLLVEAVAQLCKEFNIPVTPTQVLMHGEVTDKLGVDQWGKWDIGWLPHLGLHGAHDCGNKLRQSVMRLLEGSDKLPEVDVLVSDRVIKGAVYDGSTMVPVRALIEVLQDEYNMDVVIRSSPLKQTISIEGKLDNDTLFRHNFYYMLLSGDKRGWVSLRELCTKLDLTLTINNWSKTKKNVDVRRKKVL